MTKWLWGGIVAVVILAWALNPLVKQWLVDNHAKMALEACGGKDNIAEVTVDSYKCKEGRKS
ncbi:hypothetical protein [Pleionea sp. CnH1-48]|uniref:hypothetical protein n=1 Tax=Pleionea sp. CnH1-48 TaxID=2954494 RepID=UPI0020972504|nr:hypothetical protein [Pleionea sp. CnH1-48]MCO7224126.1 hypothetical protein [Pleionea sp. CnH1-48]